MLEKEIQSKFINDWHDKLKETLGLDKLRLYGIEFPIRTDDGSKRADLVYEVEVSNIPMENPMFVLELKKVNIDIGVCDQVKRYSHFIQKQLYRTREVKSIIAGPSFSKWELENCKKNGIFALQFDSFGNMRMV